MLIKLLNYNVTMNYTVTKLILLILEIMFV